MTYPMIVAELSANHTGSLETAKQLVQACADAGADAIKLQTWTPGTMVIDPELVIESGTWAGHNMVELYEEAHTPWEWHEQLFDLATSLGMVGFTSVFDRNALNFLENIDCPMYKIASFELVDLDLIRAVAKTGKPIIMSTGMADLSEINAAYKTAFAAGAKDITILECASAYPAQASDYNLANMHYYRDRMAGVKFGVSDHTNGLGLAVAAAAMGASLIEKHVGFGGGPDRSFSCLPKDLAALVVAVKQAVDAKRQKSPDFQPMPAELPQRAMRRSLWIINDLRMGEMIEVSDIATARPALGMPCHALPEVIGKVLTQDVKAGTPLTANLLM